MLDERIENEAGSPKPHFYVGYEQGRRMLNNASGTRRQLERADIDRTPSGAKTRSSKNQGISAR